MGGGFYLKKIKMDASTNGYNAVMFLLPVRYRVITSPVTVNPRCKAGEFCSGDVLCGKVKMLHGGAEFGVGRNQTSLVKGVTKRHNVTSWRSARQNHLK